MERQNITLSLPKEILKKGKILAAEKGISFNEFVKQLIQMNAQAEEDYRGSSKRQTKRMKEGIELGTKGKISWRRDQLHPR